jgi:(1->4)-alpha-D-glucan 1-alpha-D-glucosylmutase
MIMKDSVFFWSRQLADAVRQSAAQRRRLPVATYRLQFHPDHLTFRHAAELVSYLHQLGISHIYASPYRRVCPGAAHGYAIVDYNSLNPALGSEEDYAALLAALRALGMDHILDIVPNHMHVASGENAWWNDVLENGAASPYASYFDIDWQPVKEELQDKILLPFLGESYGRVLESGELRLEYCRGAFLIRYYSIALPLDPKTTVAILTHRMDQLQQELSKDSPELRELESIITALQHLPDRTQCEPERVAERQREKEVIKDRLDRLLGAGPAIAAFLQENVRQFNGAPGDPQSLDALEKLLDAQVYRLAHWKTAADEINFRRFFDINELAAVCMEDWKVFRDGHRFVFELLTQGKVSGLRIDHVDGLFDPNEYLWRLQWAYFDALGRAAYESSPSAEPAAEQISGQLPPPADKPAWEELEPRFLECLWPEIGGPAPSEILPWAPTEAITVATGVLPPADQPGSSPAANQPARQLPLYVVVEKILDPKEPLPADWPVAGTTGYNFLNAVNGLFVDAAGLAQLTKNYFRFIDDRLDPQEVTYQSKLLIFRVAMSSDLQLLAHRLNRISEKHRLTRDFTLNSLRLALRDVIACFPVYRTYVRKGQVSQRDRIYIQRAVAQAKRRNPATNPALFDFIRDVLLLEQPPGLDAQGAYERDMFVGRFQQVTSPVVAKGVEDTAFYRYFPLASLNEVGGVMPGKATAPEDFHAENLARRSLRPGSLICTTTHDTKRSEDVRARINVLSEIPQVWRKAVNRWVRLNRRHRREVDGLPAPSRNDEYLFYQSLLGIWPLERPDKQALAGLIERLQLYMEKATREAKVHTSWINPNADYDTAVRQFVAAVLDERPKNRFLPAFRDFHEQVVDWGLYTALSQTFLKLTSPGVPDIYQGQEVWDFSLVDPDNRRPVDYQYRRELLARLQAELSGGEAALAPLARRLAAAPRDPLLKLFVTQQALQFRNAYAQLFQQGEYLPLAAEGPRDAHVCAFAWRIADSASQPARAAVVVAPRLLARLTPLNQELNRPLPPLGDSTWQNTELLLEQFEGASFRDVFTGRIHIVSRQRLNLAQVLSDFPLALLELR